MDQILLTAYWGPRAETVESCARRLSAFLQTVGTYSPVDSVWRRKGGRPSQTARLFPTGFESIRVELEASRTPNDPPELGFSAGAWLGDADNDDSVGLSVSCGHSSPFLRNTVTLNWTFKTLLAAHTIDPVVGAKLIEALVDSWAPDWAVWIKDEWREAQQSPSTESAIGWLTYVGDPSRVQRLPKYASYRPYADGLIISAGPTIGSVTPRRVREIGHRLLS